MVILEISFFGPIPYSRIFLWRFCGYRVVFIKKWLQDLRVKNLVVKIWRIFKIFDRFIL